MKSYLQLLARHPRLIAAEVFRILCTLLLWLGVTWVVMSHVDELAQAVGFVVLAVLLVAPLAHAIYVRLYAWAMRVPAIKGASSLTLPHMLLWSQHRPSFAVRKFRALMGWSEPEQEQDDLMVHISDLPPEVLPLVTGPIDALLLIARMTGERDYLKLLRRNREAVLRVFGTLRLTRKYLGSLGLRLLYIAPFILGVGLVLSGVLAGFAAGIGIVVIASLIYSLRESTQQLRDLYLIHLMMEASLSNEEIVRRASDFGIIVNREEIGVLQDS